MQVCEAQRTEQDYLGNERLTVTRTIDGRGRCALLNGRLPLFGGATGAHRSISSTKLSNGTTHAASELHGLRAGEAAGAWHLINCSFTLIAWRKPMSYWV